MIVFGADADIGMVDSGVDTGRLWDPLLTVGFDTVRFTAASAFVVVADLFIFFVDDDRDAGIAFFQGDSGTQAAETASNNVDLDADHLTRVKEESEREV